MQIFFYFTFCVKGRIKLKSNIKIIKNQERHMYSTLLTEITNKCMHKSLTSLFYWYRLSRIKQKLNIKIIKTQKKSMYGVPLAEPPMLASNLDRN